MACSKTSLARGSPLPPSARRLMARDVAPNNLSEHNAPSTYSKALGSADIPTGFNDDRQVPAHPSGKSDISKNARSPVNVFHRSKSPETNVRNYIETDRIIHEPFVHEDCSNTSLSQPLDPLASNVSSNVVNNSSPNSAGMERIEAMCLSRKASGGHSSSASSAVPRRSFDNGGLRISSSNDMDGPRNDQSGNGTWAQNPRFIHHRSASGTSELSTASCSSMSKPTSHYVHPMRQAPRTYTPPLNQSYQASIAESDSSTSGNHVEEEIASQRGLGSLHKSMHGPSGQTPRLSLQTQEDSITKLPATSQTNLTGRPSLGYSRDTGSILDTASPISRSSLDFSFRSKTRASMDPISRAATVQAARQAFEEKEAAKARKIEEQQLKAEARQMKRKEKQSWRVSLRQDECQEQMWQKDSSKVHRTSAPLQPAPQSGRAPDTWKTQPKNTWMHFLTWLRTRLFKIKRRINESK